MSAGDDEDTSDTSDAKDAVAKRDASRENDTPTDSAMAPGLYVVSTPIGNLGDITLRALEALRGCDRVLAEDTRRTRALLAHFGIAKRRVESLPAFKERDEAGSIAASIRPDERVCVVSDAGTPLVSDPGALLVGEARALGLRVVPVVGASAVLGALVLAGFDTGGGFRFFGFPAQSGKRRREVLERISQTPETCVVFEAPTRIAELLTDLAAKTPARAACVVRELTKMFEEAVFGTVTELAAREGEWRGEIVLVLAPFAAEDTARVYGDDEVDAMLARAREHGEHPKSAAQRIARETGKNARDLYARIVKLKD